MPPPFRFPFRYGSIPAPVPSVVTAPSFWGNPWTVASVNWQDQTDPRLVPRLERVYDQVPDIPSEQIEFAHRITAEFPWIVGNGNQIYLRSAITSP